jgi:hypothetical protein
VNEKFKNVGQAPGRTFEEKLENYSLAQVNAELKKILASPVESLPSESGEK